MKKRAIAAAAFIFLLSSCGQISDIEDEQTGIMNSVVQIDDITSEVQEIQIGDATSEMQEVQNDNTAGSSSDTKAEERLAEEETALFQSDAKSDVLEKLTGEYEYLSEDGIGKLVISKTSYGYEISDYESESSYRFLADSSNIDTIEKNRIYIKYPEQVFSDDTVIFSYYILEYSTYEIKVYYKKDVHGEEQFLYCAARKQGAISPSETTVTESDNQDKAIELYVNVLREYISAGRMDFTVSFIDLDDDSIREMVVFFGKSQADGGCLFTIKNEEAVQVLSEDCDCFGQYGGFTYKEKGSVFVTEKESVTDAQISNQIFYYTMENGNAVCNDVTQSITQFDSGESRFYVNDTEVESEKFDSIAEKYGLSEMSTVSCSDGVRVTNGQMELVYNAYNN